MTDPGSSRGSYAKGRARREQILTEATALFAEVGYRAASLRDLAERCGISPAGLLHHVRDKEQLLLDVLARRDEASGAWLSTQSGRARLTALADLVRDNESQRGIVELFCVLSAEATAAEHPARPWFAERYRRAVAAVAEAFAECGHPEPRAAAHRLLAVSDGLQVQWLLDPEVPMGDAFAAHLALELAVTD